MTEPPFRNNNSYFYGLSLLLKLAAGRNWTKEWGDLRAAQAEAIGEGGGEPATHILGNIRFRDN